MNEQKVVKAVVLLSGGLDSGVALAHALHRGRQVIALFIDYGQRCKTERFMALQLVEHYKKLGRRILLKEGSVKLGFSSDLTNSSADLSKVGAGYVPCRNSVLLSLAYGIAEAEGCEEVWIGTTYTPRDGNEDRFPDASEIFLKASEVALNLGSRAGSSGKEIKLVSPLSDLAKADVVGDGVDLAFPFHFSWSCWKSGKKPCNRCKSCSGRAEAFALHGMEDPLTAFS